MNLKKLFLPIVSFCLALAAYGESIVWMDAIPDDVCVRAMSIPGTHDAATGNGFSPLSAVGAAFAGETQTLTISEQWDAGVRAFDLRPTYKSDADGKLKIYHGVLETKITLKDALQTIKDKLIACPKEFAVILIRHESDSDDNSTEWPGAMSALLAEFDDYIVPFSPALTLGAARGKMLILTRDAFTSEAAGVIADWSHSEAFDDQKNATIALGRSKARLYVQDFYECQTAERKTAAISNLLDYSVNNTDDDIWVINHASGYTGSTGTNSNIRKNAAAANKFIVDYLAQSEVEGRTGIVMMDFAGEDRTSSTNVYGDELLATIINNNAYLKTPVDPDTSGVDDVAVDCASDCRIYNLFGVLVGEGREALSALPAGIYIMNGKKILVR